MNIEYLNNIYNCTSCIVTKYVLYNSLFFERNICVSPNEELCKKHNLSDFDFSKGEKTSLTSNKCPPIYFTPDGKYYYICYDRFVWMVECSGECSFSTERVNLLECGKNNCKTGYLET